MFAMVTGVLLGQLAQPGIDTPEEAALIFSGPQFFIALLSGAGAGLRVSAPADQPIPGGGHFLRGAFFVL
jgi:hypothetical protein